MNKHTLPAYSTLLRNKLGKVAISLQSKASPTGTNTDLATLEQTISEGMKMLGKFYKELSEPGFVPVDAVLDQAPYLKDWNDNFDSVGGDLEVVFQEFENLEAIVLGNFNYMVSQLNRLSRGLKQVSSKVSDFALYSSNPTKDASFVGDSFNNLTRIEANSPLLNQTQCEINQEEGIATLPSDRSSQKKILISELPVINDNSNGIPGNNQEIGATLHNSISDILDANADTWFEYEKVGTTEDSTPLTLDITINLGASKIINFIRINPNNFGVRSQVQILKIDTSIDGKSFVSIKDDIPIAGFTTQDEENIFSLAPSTSKFAGQGIFSFTPRKAKYIRLSFKQTTPYTIKTTKGTKLRYAIGIRDIHIEAVPYKTKGEVISTAYKFSDEVKKVALFANQNPSPATTSKLASIQHYISPDNGVSWHELRPLVSTGTPNLSNTVPEILDFNGVGTNTITTTSPVTSLRYKAVLARDTSAFTDDSEEMAQELVDVTELHTPPSTTPFDITLQKVPTTGSLKLLEPNYGSRGLKDNTYPIAVGNGGKLIIELPFDIKLDTDHFYAFVPLETHYMRRLDGDASPGYTVALVEPQTVLVNGQTWTNDLDSGSASTDTHYRLDFDQNTLEFGDGTTGKAVPLGAIVSMYLQEERLFPGVGKGHIAKLDYPTVADKSQVTVQLLKPLALKTSVLKPGATRHRLHPNIAHEYNWITFSDTAVFSNEVDSIAELTTAGDWYCNYDTGLLQHTTPTATKKITTAVYTIQERLTLTDTQWDFADSAGGTTDAISIADTAYQTFKVSSSNPVGLAASSYYSAIGQQAIVPGSVEFVTSSGVMASGVYGTEMQYKDGREELKGVLATKEAISAISTVTAGTPTNITKTFHLRISTETDLEVSFANINIFQTDKTDTSIVNIGDYSIDRTNNQYTVRVDQNYLDPGIVSYYYNDPRIDLTGAYSINYNTGEAFFHDLTGGGDKVAYEYTHYIAKYPVAREIPTVDWTFNKTSNKITVKDREILKSMRVPQTSDRGRSSTAKYYQVSYKSVKASREDVAELEPYFTPVLKDYALKIITSARFITQ